MILSVNDIRFSYNSHAVLDDVSFCVGKGSVLAILGVNGAGKSTLLKCLNRILRPQSGLPIFWQSVSRPRKRQQRQWGLVLVEV